MNCIVCKEVIVQAEHSPTLWNHLSSLKNQDGYDHYARPNPEQINCEQCKGSGACPKCGGMGEHAPAKTVRVRIAVAVDKFGNWNSSGWQKQGNKFQEDDMVGFAIEGTTCEPTSVFWLEADLPIPTEEVIKAEVNPDAK